MSVDERHLQARDLYAQSDYPAALEIIDELLDENPNDAAALFLLGGIFIQTNKRGMAYNIMARCAKFTPERPEVWVNFGKCQTDSEEGWALAEDCFNKAIELNPEIVSAYSNMSSIKIQKCEPDAGLEYANKALEIDPDHTPAKSCLGFAYLMKQDWKKGFENYDNMMGHVSRPYIHYNDAPIWDGTPGKTIMVNGEQGIGDELIYSSFLRDAAKENKIVYDCMPRLKSLMERSFQDDPNIYVSGSRWSEVQAVPEQFMPNASISIGSLGQYFRETDNDFDGKPYLKPDNDIRKAMRGLLDSISDKPKVGIAWTGGTRQSRRQFRQKSLEMFTPFLRNDDVDFISLQYKDFSEEIEEYRKARKIKIHDFPWITQVKDYDLTAALVAELDLVIGVPTSVCQLSGAVGTDAWVLVPEITGWLFYPQNYVWSNHVKLFHKWTPKTVEKALKNWVKNGTSRELLTATN